MDNLTVSEGKVEVFVLGEIEDHFSRLNIRVVDMVIFKDSYETVGVATLTPFDYMKLIDDIGTDANWNSAGWQKPKGSNLGIPVHKATVNKKPLMCWIENDTVEDDEWLNDWFVDLLEYLDTGVGATSFRNASAVMSDLAKYNGMSITELIRNYVKQESVINPLGCVTSRLKSEGGN